MANIEEKLKDQREIKPGSEWAERKPKEEAEKKVEVEIEKKIEKAPPTPPKKEKIEKKVPVPSIKLPAIPTPIVPKSETQQKIETILMENLEDLYNSLNEIQQKTIREKKEETASKIEQLLKAIKIKIKEILKLIKGFFKIIPGLNKFFLEQEAKIKTDKILSLKEKDENRE